MGDWLPPQGWMPGSVILEKEENGIWTYTTEILPSDLYAYTFLIDGVKTIDPNNAFTQRDIANISSIFLIDGGQGDCYKPQFMVPNTMDGKYEETFPDIIHFVENNNRVKADKANRAIAGLSIGGFHSLHISRYFPNTFDYVGLFSAAILPNQNVSHKVYKNMDSTLKKQLENGYKLYWIGMGKTDFLYKSGVEYRAKLDEIGFKYTYRESEGGHTWKNWRVYLTEFLPLLF
jgi:hypothetical protein